MSSVRGLTAPSYSVTSEQFGVYEVEMASRVSVEVPASVTGREGEAALVARATRGDHQAYATLVRPHERVAYRVAAAITGWNADAEEATQNAFVKAHRSLPRFRVGAAFRPWLLRIVVNEAHNVLRAERRHARLEVRAREQHAVAIEAVDEAVLEREEVERVIAALARLPDADRVAVVLRYFAELPDQEAAELVGTSKEAYRVRLVRARKRLQVLLEEADV
jgi:RNA polymerase sigma factor (sigma-70 family)